MSESAADADTNPAPMFFTLPADAHDPSSFPEKPKITSFTAQGAVPVGMASALQIEEGGTVELTWTLEGEVTALALDGANVSLDKSLTSYKVTPKQDTAYVLRAQNGAGDDSAQLFVSLHAKQEAVAPAASVAPGVQPGPIATNVNGDLYVDPPVRILCQFDDRWLKRQVAGKKVDPVPPGLTWQESACGPTSTSMILRWFAEDCRAGRMPFPTKKQGSQIDPSWYPLRMAEFFWPAADPAGKVANFPEGPLDLETLYGMAAHMLKSGGDYDPKARGETKSQGSWLSDIKSMLTAGPVILGMGDPAPGGHFCVVQGFAKGALLILDPGKVIWKAVRGGAKTTDKKTGKEIIVISDWTGIQGYTEGDNGVKGAAVRVAPESQWPGGKAPAGERHVECYCSVTGDALDRLMKHTKNVYSLTWPEGPKLNPLSGVLPPPPAQAYVPKPPPSKTSNAGSDAIPVKSSGKLDVFFTYDGQVGESENPTPHLYTGYQQENAFASQGKKTPWFLKGRLMIDLDGAPNCYDIHDANVLPLAQYKDKFETWTGSLDKMKNGGHPGNWFGILTDTQEKTGNPVFQKDTDPFPGFCIATTSLVDKTKRTSDPSRYTNAVKVPYIAFPKQIWNEGKTGSLFKKKGQGSTGNLGDFVTIFNLKDGSSIAHAVIADIGDKPHFGEVSPATAKQLNDFSGVVTASFLYIIYPGSGAGQGTIPSHDDVLSAGKTLFDAFGGMDEVKRVLALMD